MADKKTSAEKTREEEQNAAADNMFGGAFGGLDQMEAPSETEEIVGNTELPVEEPEQSVEEGESEIP